MKPLLFQEAVSAEGLGEVPFLSFTRLRRWKEHNEANREGCSCGEETPSPSWPGGRGDQVPLSSQKEPLAMVLAGYFQGDSQTRTCSGPGRYSWGLPMKMASWTPAPSTEMFLFVPHVRRVFSLMVSIVVHSVSSSKVRTDRR